MKSIDSANTLPKFSDIIAAQSVLRKVIKETALERSKSFSTMSGAEVYLKLENLQTTGSFKVRGAYYKIANLTSTERSKGVLCASAGNHAQGVAYAASALGVKSTVFMPVFAPPLKVIATRSYGAEVILSGETFDDAFNAALEYQTKTGATFVHPFNDFYIIAGQGTIGLEIFDQFRDVTDVVVPIGGGGLISGMAIALKQLNPKIRIIGVEPEGAQSMKKSIEAGKPELLNSVDTIADGIAVKSPGNLTFEATNQWVDELLVVNDAEIARTAYLLLQRAKILAEPAGVAAMAAVLYKKFDFSGRKVVPVISGGNINMSILEQILEKGVMDEGYRARISVLIPDQAGKLKSIITVLEQMKANIHEISHERSITSVPIGYVETTLTFNLQDTSQLPTILAELEKKGMHYQVLH
ncbi:MAG: threonine ammonia-lyase [Lentimicrobium sp.]|jgi:threonine dehydratase|nr:threonine ammonia-lyase [Lentimicrobium sp.]MDD2528055.1 threonine ammonia-lyase [Lentimicrobiaceae bacterium]MDD4597684.1 threonine ammonia-lyase [Lentimicrobiaceae bacterium]MDY0025556.1 threonine ammonia-lyase [Lentimicrobium sp.]